MAFYIYKMKKGEPEDLDLTELSALDIKVGDTVIITAAGHKYDDLNVTIERKHRYETKKDKWFEATAPYRSGRAGIEVYQEDEMPKVRVSLPQENITLDDLRLTEEDLIRMDDNQSHPETIEFDCSRWKFQESDEVRFFEDSNRNSESYYSWEFVEENNARILYIEKWEDEPFSAGVSTIVNPNDIRIFRS